MSDFTKPQTRTTPENINQMEATLDAALEHASHGWSAFERETKVSRVNPDFWPPEVKAPVGSAQYHFAAMIDAVHRAYQIIRTEQDRMNGVSSPNTE
jgi:N-acyl-D-aspartate/D-glutamate deacylase